MNSSIRILLGAATIVALAACKPSSTVGSPGTTATPAANRAPVVPAGVTAATIAEGKTLYEAQANNCIRCHGLDARGGTRGPSLADSVWVQINGSYPEITRIIIEGVPAAKFKGSYPNPMAPKGRAPITDSQVASIAAYLWSLSNPH